MLKTSTSGSLPKNKWPETAKVLSSYKESDAQRIMIVMGDHKVGKSTFIENLDTKGASSKARSFGLQYSYSEFLYLNQNIVANYYEVSGGLKSSHLLQYPINSSNINDAAVFLLVDCSTLEAAFNHLEQWLPAIHAELEKKAELLIKEGKKDLVQQLRGKRVESIRSNPDFKSEKDYKLTLIPLVIVAHRFDLYEKNEP